MLISLSRNPVALKLGVAAQTIVGPSLQQQTHSTIERMDSDIKELLEALGDWRKACNKLERAIPDPIAAEAKLAVAQDRVVSVLRRDGVTKLVNDLIQSSRPQVIDSPQVFRNTLHYQPEPIAAAEIEASRPLNLSHRELDQLILAYLKADPDVTLIASDRDLLEALPLLHSAIAAQYLSSRLVGRKEKKRRKRKIATGATFAAIGLGLIAANTQTMTATAPYSYILGGNALLQAIRDLIGEAADV